MFDQYPKSRQALPEEYARIYVRHYRENRIGGSVASGAAQSLESWLHRQIAADLGRARGSAETLELGAGTLNQLLFEPPCGPYDIVEPFTELYRDAVELVRVRNVFSDIRDVPDDFRYDRIISSAVLEHLCDLPEVVARSCLLLADEGRFLASIPSEGTWLWRLGWRMTTGLEFRLRYGLDYGKLMQYEHVNTAREIEEVLRYFYAEVSMKVFGLSRGISLYQHFACAGPNGGRAREYLNC
ncbi:MAG: hypothetical protein KBG75_03980 [Pseudomonadales bacterium]|nr:hypothetical protein [Pseudomonadales bacterium]